MVWNSVVGLEKLYLLTGFISHIFPAILIRALHRWRSIIGLEAAAMPVLDHIHPASEILPDFSGRSEPSGTGETQPSSLLRSSASSRSCSSACAKLLVWIPSTALFPLPIFKRFISLVFYPAAHVWEPRAASAVAGLLLPGLRNPPQEGGRKLSCLYCSSFIV